MEDGGAIDVGGVAGDRDVQRKSHGQFPVSVSAISQR
jgi:hypothetical protein